MPDRKNLNEAQRKAVTYGEGPLLLLAGPGSGKTFTIANRILYLIKNGVPPESILVVTFTREAALSMRRRFGEMSGGMNYPVPFGTFHSLFYQILQKSNFSSAKRLLGNSEKKTLLLPILKQYQELHHNEAMLTPPQETAEDLREDAAQLLSAFGYYKNTMKLEEALKKAPRRWQADFGAVMAAYERRVEEKGAMDFDDMLFSCRKLLSENEELRRTWQNRFTHILIDEFQDINPVQYEAIKLLTRKPYNIFAVGDDDQAIYGFRGAEPDCLRRFAKEFGAGRLLLDTNYRSVEEIVRVSLAVIGENKNRFRKELHAAAAHPQNKGEAEASGVVCTALRSREEQYRYLIGALERRERTQLKRTGRQPETCAVLFRTNSYMQGFAARLKRAGIPYEIKERAESIYEHFAVKDVMAYLSLAHGSGGKEDLLRIVNKPPRYVSREAVAECGADFERLRAYYKNPDGKEAPGRGRRLSAENALNLLERQLRVIGKLSLHLGVDYILRAAGYERYLSDYAGGNEEKRQMCQELTEWLRGDAAQYESLGEWERAQRMYAETLSAGGDRRNTAGRENETGGQGQASPVQLMTVHGAKGLEFDRVWIPDCNERVFPHGRLQDEKTLEEERRIFYVAMTRAKKSLELLYLTGTKERPRQPSEFLNAVYGSSISSSNSQLSRYSSKASATFSYSSSSSM